MHQISEARRWFFKRFYETKTGQILGLATPTEHLRDGLATTHAARGFPNYAYPGIVVGPGRPSLEPAPNLILIGSRDLFIDGLAHPCSGAPPLSLGREKIGERLRTLSRNSCYKIVGDRERKIVNTVTGQEYVPKTVGKNRQVDYGLITRLNRSSSEFTIVEEGVHFEGTLGAVAVAGNDEFLEAIHRKLLQLPDFDEHGLVEVLVEACYQPQHPDDIIAIETISARPLAVVFNRTLICDLLDDEKPWVDQLPWDTQVWIHRDAAPSVVPRQMNQPPPPPYLEVRADLAGVEPGLAELCHKLWPPDGTAGPGSLTEAEADRLLDLLTAEVDQFTLELVRERPIPRRVELSGNLGGTIGRIRKSFLLHLVWCRALGRHFRSDEPTIRRVFPDFNPGGGRAPFTTRFASNVKGRLDINFKELLGKASRRPRLMSIVTDRKARSYALHLERAALMIRLRF